MKRLLTIGLALALSACTAATTTAPAPVPALPPPPTAIQAVTAKADTVILQGERAFAVAELTYTVAANGAGRLVDAGLMPSLAVARVRAWNAEARSILIKGKSVADMAERARLAARLFALSDQLDTVGAR